MCKEYTSLIEPAFFVKEKKESNVECKSFGEVLTEIISIFVMGDEGE